MGEKITDEAREANRVTFDSDGHLDEIVTDAGAHLEHLGGKRWFLSCQRADGTICAVWFTGKITHIEEQGAPICDGCGEAIPAHPPLDGPYITCPACGWSAQPKTA